MSFGLKQDGVAKRRTYGRCDTSLLGDDDAVYLQNGNGNGGAMIVLYPPYQYGSYNLAQQKSHRLTLT
jgi:hypothetical protein